MQNFQRFLHSYGQTEKETENIQKILELNEFVSLVQSGNLVYIALSNLASLNANNVAQFKIELQGIQQNKLIYIYKENFSLFYGEVDECFDDHINILRESLFSNWNVANSFKLISQMDLFQTQFSYIQKTNIPDFINTDFVHALLLFIDDYQPHVKTKELQEYSLQLESLISHFQLPVANEEEATISFSLFSKQLLKENNEQSIPMKALFLKARKVDYSFRNHAVLIAKLFNSIMYQLFLLQTNVENNLKLQQLAQVPSKRLVDLLAFLAVQNHIIESIRQLTQDDDFLQVIICLRQFRIVEAENLLKLPPLSMKQNESYDRLIQVLFDRYQLVEQRTLLIQRKIRLFQVGFQKIFERTEYCHCQLAKQQYVYHLLSQQYATLQTLTSNQIIREVIEMLVNCCEADFKICFETLENMLEQQIIDDNVCVIIFSILVQDISSFVLSLLSGLGSSLMKLSNLFEFDVLVANNVSDGNESMDTIRVFPEKVKEIFYINVNVISFLRAILISGGIFFQDYLYDVDTPVNDSVSERRFYDYLGFNPRFVKFENNIPRSCLIVILYFVSSLYSVPVVDMIKHKLTKIKSSIIRNSIALEPIYKQIYRQIAILDENLQISQYFMMITNLIQNISQVNFLDFLEPIYLAKKFRKVQEEKQNLLVQKKQQQSQDDERNSNEVQLTIKEGLKLQTADIIGTSNKNLFDQLSKHPISLQLISITDLLFVDFFQNLHQLIEQLLQNQQFYTVDFKYLLLMQRQKIISDLLKVKESQERQNLQQHLIMKQQQYFSQQKIFQFQIFSSSVTSVDKLKIYLQIYVDASKQYVMDMLQQSFELKSDTIDIIQWLRYVKTVISPLSRIVDDRFQNYIFHVYELLSQKLTEQLRKRETFVVDILRNKQIKFAEILYSSILNPFNEFNISKIVLFLYHLQFNVVDFGQLVDIVDNIQWGKRLLSFDKIKIIKEKQHDLNETSKNLLFQFLKAFLSSRISNEFKNQIGSSIFIVVYPNKSQKKSCNFKNVIQENPSLHNFLVQSNQSLIQFNASQSIPSFKQQVPKLRNMQRFELAITSEQMLDLKISSRQSSLREGVEESTFSQELINAKSLQQFQQNILTSDLDIGSQLKQLSSCNDSSSVDDLQLNIAHPKASHDLEYQNQKQYLQEQFNLHKVKDVHILTFIYSIYGSCNSFNDIVSYLLQLSIDVQYPSYLNQISYELLSIDRLPFIAIDDQLANYINIASLASSINVEAKVVIELREKILKQLSLFTVSSGLFILDILSVEYLLLYLTFNITWSSNRALPLLKTLKDKYQSIAFKMSTFEQNYQTTYLPFKKNLFISQEQFVELYLNDFWKLQPQQLSIKQIELLFFKALKNIIKYLEIQYISLSQFVQKSQLINTQSSTIQGYFLTILALSSEFTRKYEIDISLDNLYEFMKIDPNGQSSLDSFKDLSDNLLKACVQSFQNSFQNMVFFDCVTFLIKFIKLFMQIIDSSNCLKARLQYKNSKFLIYPSIESSTQIIIDLTKQGVNQFVSNRQLHFFSINAYDEMQDRTIEKLQCYINFRLLTPYLKFSNRMSSKMMQFDRIEKLLYLYKLESTSCEIMGSFDNSFTSFLKYNGRVCETILPLILVDKFTSVSSVEEKLKSQLLLLEYKQFVQQQLRTITQQIPFADNRNIIELINFDFDFILKLISKEIRILLAILLEVFQQQQQTKFKKFEFSTINLEEINNFQEFVTLIQYIELSDCYIQLMNEFSIHFQEIISVLYPRIPVHFDSLYTKYMSQYQTDLVFTQQLNVFNQQLQRQTQQYKYFLSEITNQLYKQLAEKVQFARSEYFLFYNSLSSTNPFTNVYSIIEQQNIQLLWSQIENFKIYFTPILRQFNQNKLASNTSFQRFILQFDFPEQSEMTNYFQNILNNYSDQLYSFSNAIQEAVFPSVLCLVGQKQQTLIKFYITAVNQDVVGLFPSQQLCQFLNVYQTDLPENDIIDSMRDINNILKEQQSAIFVLDTQFALLPSFSNSFIIIFQQFDVLKQTCVCQHFTIPTYNNSHQLLQISEILKQNLDFAQICRLQLKQRIQYSEMLEKSIQQQGLYSLLPLVPLQQYLALDKSISQQQTLLHNYQDLVFSLLLLFNLTIQEFCSSINHETVRQNGLFDYFSKLIGEKLHVPYHFQSSTIEESVVSLIFNQHLSLSIVGQVLLMIISYRCQYIIDFLKDSQNEVEGVNILQELLAIALFIKYYYCYELQRFFNSQLTHSMLILFCNTIKFDYINLNFGNFVEYTLAPHNYGRFVNAFQYIKDYQHIQQNVDRIKTSIQEQLHKISILNSNNYLNINLQQFILIIADFQSYDRQLFDLQKLYRNSISFDNVNKSIIRLKQELYLLIKFLNMISNVSQKIVPLLVSHLHLKVDFIMQQYICSQEKTQICSFDWSGFKYKNIFDSSKYIQNIIEHFVATGNTLIHTTNIALQEQVVDDQERVQIIKHIIPLYKHIIKQYPYSVMISPISYVLDDNTIIPEDNANKFSLIKGDSRALTPQFVGFKSTEQCQFSEYIGDCFILKDNQIFVDQLFLKQLFYQSPQSIVRFDLADNIIQQWNSILQRLFCEKDIISLQNYQYDLYLRELEMILGSWQEFITSSDEFMRKMISFSPSTGILNFESFLSSCISFNSEFVLIMNQEFYETNQGCIIFMGDHAEVQKQFCVCNQLSLILNLNILQLLVVDQIFCIGILLKSGHAIVFVDKIVIGLVNSVTGQIQFSSIAMIINPLQQQINKTYKIVLLMLHDQYFQQPENLFYQLSFFSHIQTSQIISDVLMNSDVTFTSTIQGIYSVIEEIILENVSKNSYSDIFIKAQFQIKTPSKQTTRNFESFQFQINSLLINKFQQILKFPEQIICNWLVNFVTLKIAACIVDLPNKQQQFVGTLDMLSEFSQEYNKLQSSIEINFLIEYYRTLVISLQLNSNNIYDNIQYHLQTAKMFDFMKAKPFLHDKIVQKFETLIIDLSQDNYSEIQLLKQLQNRQMFKDYTYLKAVLQLEVILRFQTQVHQVAFFLTSQNLLFDDRFFFLFSYWELLPCVSYNKYLDRMNRDEVQLLESIPKFHPQNVTTQLFNQQVQSNVQEDFVRSSGFPSYCNIQSPFYRLSNFHYKNKYGNCHCLSAFRCVFKLGSSVSFNNFSFAETNLIFCSRNELDIIDGLAQMEQLLNLNNSTFLIKNYNLISLNLFSFFYGKQWAFTNNCNIKFCIRNNSISIIENIDQTDYHYIHGIYCNFLDKRMAQQFHVINDKYGIFALEYCNNILIVQNQQNTKDAFAYDFQQSYYSEKIHIFNQLNLLYGFKITNYFIIQMIKRELQQFIDFDFSVFSDLTITQDQFMQIVFYFKLASQNDCVINGMFLDYVNYMSLEHNNALLGMEEQDIFEIVSCYNEKKIISMANKRLDQVGQRIMLSQICELFANNGIILCQDNLKFALHYILNIELGRHSFLYVKPDVNHSTLLSLLQSLSQLTKLQIISIVFENLSFIQDQVLMYKINLNNNKQLQVKLSNNGYNLNLRLNDYEIDYFVLQYYQNMLCFIEDELLVSLLKDHDKKHQLLVILQEILFYVNESYNSLFSQYYISPSNNYVYAFKNFKSLQPEIRLLYQITVVDSLIYSLFLFLIRYDYVQLSGYTSFKSFNLNEFASKIYYKIYKEQYPSINREIGMKNIFCWCYNKEARQFGSLSSNNVRQLNNISPFQFYYQFWCDIEFSMYESSKEATAQYFFYDADLESTTFYLQNYLIQQYHAIILIISQNFALDDVINLIMEELMNQQSSYLLLQFDIYCPNILQIINQILQQIYAKLNIQIFCVIFMKIDLQDSNLTKIKQCFYIKKPKPLILLEFLQFELYQLLMINIDKLLFYLPNQFVQQNILLKYSGIVLKMFVQLAKSEQYLRLVLAVLSERLIKSQQIICLTDLIVDSIQVVQSLMYLQGHNKIIKREQIVQLLTFTYNLPKNINLDIYRFDDVSRNFSDQLVDEISQKLTFPFMNKSTTDCVYFFNFYDFNNQKLINSMSQNFSNSKQNIVKNIVNGFRMCARNQYSVAELLSHYFNLLYKYDLNVVLFLNPIFAPLIDISLQLFSKYQNIELDIIKYVEIDFLNIDETAVQLIGSIISKFYQDYCINCAKNRRDSIYVVLLKNSQFQKGQSQAQILNALLNFNYTLVNRLPLEIKNILYQIQDKSQILQNTQFNKSIIPIIIENNNVDSQIICELQRQDNDIFNELISQKINEFVDQQLQMIEKEIHVYNNQYLNLFQIFHQRMSGLKVEKEKFAHQVQQLQTWPSPELLYFNISQQYLLFIKILSQIGFQIIDQNIVHSKQYNIISYENNNIDGKLELIRQSILIPQDKLKQVKILKMDLLQSSLQYQESERVLTLKVENVKKEVQRLENIQNHFLQVTDKLMLLKNQLQLQVIQSYKELENPTNIHKRLLDCLAILMNIPLEQLKHVFLQSTVPIVPNFKDFEKAQFLLIQSTENLSQEMRFVALADIICYFNSYVALNCLQPSYIINEDIYKQQITITRNGPDINQINEILQLSDDTLQILKIALDRMFIFQDQNIKLGQFGYNYEWFRHVSEKQFMKTILQKGFQFTNLSQVPQDSYQNVYQNYLNVDFAPIIYRKNIIQSTYWKTCFSKDSFLSKELVQQTNLNYQKQTTTSDESYNALTMIFVAPKSSYEKIERNFSHVVFSNCIQQINSNYITDEQIELLAPYLECPDFNSFSTKHSSFFTQSLLNWIYIIIALQKNSKQVLPLLNIMEEKNQQFKKLQHQLENSSIANNVAGRQLQKVREIEEELIRQLTITTNEQSALEKEKCITELKYDIIKSDKEVENKLQFMLDLVTFLPQMHQELIQYQYFGSVAEQQSVFIYPYFALQNFKDFTQFSFQFFEQHITLENLKVVDILRLFPQTLQCSWLTLNQSIDLSLLFNDFRFPLIIDLNEQFQFTLLVWIEMCELFQDQLSSLPCLTKLTADTPKFTFSYVFYSDFQQFMMDYQWTTNSVARFILINIQQKDLFDSKFKQFIFKLEQLYYQRIDNGCQDLVLLYANCNTFDNFKNHLLFNTYQYEMPIENQLQICIHDAMKTNFEQLYYRSFIEMLVSHIDYLFCQQSVLNSNHSDRYLILQMAKDQFYQSQARYIHLYDICNQQYTILKKLYFTKEKIKYLNIYSYVVASSYQNISADNYQVFEIIVSLMNSQLQNMMPLQEYLQLYFKQLNNPFVNKFIYLFTTQLQSFINKFGSFQDTHQQLFWKYIQFLLLSGDKKIKQLAYMFDTSCKSYLNKYMQLKCNMTLLDSYSKQQLINLEPFYFIYPECLVKAISSFFGIEPSIAGGIIFISTDIRPYVDVALFYALGFVDQYFQQLELLPQINASLYRKASYHNSTEQIYLRYLEPKFEYVLYKQYLGLNLDVTNIVVNILLKPDMLKINDEIGVIGYYLNIKPFYTNHYKLNNTSLVYKLFSGQLNQFIYEESFDTMLLSQQSSNKLLNVLLIIDEQVIKNLFQVTNCITNSRIKQIVDGQIASYLISIIYASIVFTVVSPISSILINTVLQRIIDNIASFCQECDYYMMPNEEKININLLKCVYQCYDCFYSDYEIEITPTQITSPKMHINVCQTKQTTRLTLMEQFAEKINDYSEPIDIVTVSEVIQTKLLLKVKDDKLIARINKALQIPISRKSFQFIQQVNQEFNCDIQLELDLISE